MSPHYGAVSARARHVCEYCHAPEVIFNLPFEVEHVIPRSRGGETIDSNLALSCRSCNLYKADFITGFDEVTQQEVRLFDPRRDTWDEHFSAPEETGEIEGLTEIARAAIARLRINGRLQVEARKQWIRLGLLI